MDLQLAVQIQQWQRPLDSCATCPEAHQKCLSAKQPASLRAALPSLTINSYLSAKNIIYKLLDEWRLETHFIRLLKGEYVLEIINNIVSVDHYVFLCSLGLLCLKYCISSPKNKINQQKWRIYPLVNIQQAIENDENGPVEIVDFPINSMVIFHSYVTVHKRVTWQSVLAVPDCFVSIPTADQLITISLIEGRLETVRNRDFIWENI